MEQFLEKFMEVLEVEQLNPEDEFREFEEWDSLAYLSLIAMIDEEYDLVISGKEFKKFNKIRDIYNHINLHYQN